MNNNQYLLFERNRYYAGKMLTSADFIAEQKYFMNKQRFMNNMMYGSSIVCGLGVVSLDDLSLLVESGVAIDGMGREVVVDSAVRGGYASGQGTLYGKDGNMVYQGQFEDSKFAGNGVLFYAAGAVGYNGQFSDNRFNGTGKLFWPNGNREYYYARR